MSVLSVYTTYFLVLSVLGAQYRDNHIHEYMTEPEIAYIFDSEDLTNIPEYEIIYLPAPKMREALNEWADVEINYGFKAFNDYISLNLKPNRILTAPSFKTYVWDDDLLPAVRQQPINCHYMHRNGSSLAALSMCTPREIQGLIFFENTTLELHPLPVRLHNILKRSQKDKYPHIVRRATLRRDILNDEAFPIAGNLLSIEAATHRPAPRMTAELALFFDEPAYKIFAPYFDYDDNKLRDMLLAYVNGVQALYHHPTIGDLLELSLVRMDIMKKQPAKMPHYQGERMKLLDSFCEYQRSLNPEDDDDPNHWDMALYISGLDFFAYENGKKNGATMGLATVGGVCLGKYNCIIAELGTTNVYGKPYPSAGFNSVYILAHEIGHNLGMHHDSTGNKCPKEGYIMSPSRGTNGETQWSSCSAEVMLKLSSSAKCLHDLPRPNKMLDHNRFLDSPGQVYTAKRQCEVLLRDKSAVINPSQQLNTICYNLQCKTPKKSGFYYAGPALEGTLCGKQQYCYGGECVFHKPDNPPKVVPGGWGPWRKSSCTSGCIEKSLGYQTKQRYCSNPVPVNTDQGCEGSSYTVGLCDDTRICKAPRRDIVSYASAKCRDFSKLLPELDSKGQGLQAPHEEGRLWMGCAIFCKRADSTSFFTPRVELNDLGESPYFPDGTWCHQDNNKNYYCLQHHCLPEDFQFGKDYNSFWEDIPQNAFPSEEIPKEIKDYMSLGKDGKPILDMLKPDKIKEMENKEWEMKDYIELPQE